MKTFLSIGLVSLCALFIASGQSESEIEVKQFSESLIKRFESLPDNEAFDLWSQSLDPVIAGCGMMDSALENSRTDFLKKVFKEQATYTYVIEGVIRMPISKKRDQMVLMMLRSESQFWHGKVEEVYNGSRGVLLDNAIEPFVGTIRKYLPTLAIDEDLFATKAKRAELATNLEHAMTAKRSYSTNEVLRKNKKWRSHEEYVESPPPSISENAGSPTNKRDPNNSFVTRAIIYNWGWLILASIVFIFAGFIVFLKGKRGS